VHKLSTALADDPTFSLESGLNTMEESRLWPMLVYRPKLLRNFIHLLLEDTLECKPVIPGRTDCFHFTGIKQAVPNFVQQLAGQT
jgi:hypothetical protein